jgi:outer membrane protein TolC
VKLFPLLVTLLATSAVAFADARPITLTEAVAIARDGNDTRAAQAVAAERARVQVGAAEGIDDLVIDASVEGLTRSTEPSAGPFFQETDVEAVSTRVGVWKPLSWGGRVGVHLSDGMSRTEALLAAGGPASMLAYTVHTPRAELVWQQPLLRGRGRDVHDAGRRVARAGADAEDAMLDLADTRLVLDVSRAYWELAYATREVSIRESSLALAGEQLAITRARVGAGKGAELEVLAVEQAMAAREAGLVAAQQALGERALELRVLLALEDGDPRPLAASDALDTATPAAADARDARDALAKTLAFSPELKTIDSRSRGAEARARAARRGTGPQLDLLVRGGPTGNAAEASDAFEQMVRFDGYQAGASLSLTLPVGDRAARGEREMARLEQKQLAHLREASRGRLTAEVQRAFDAVALSDKRITAAVRAAELAQRTVELEIARWKTGAGTNFDVLTRQDQKAAADAALARAYADRKIAVAALAALTGP